jgi:hypothetical protein
MKNIEALGCMKISLIIPLKRNSRLIDYSIDMDKHFMFQDHTIFYSRYGGRKYPCLHSGTIS